MSDRYFIRSSALLLAGLAVCAVPRRAAAQATTTLLPDATVLAPRSIRFRLLTSWTRYDEFLGDSASPRNIAAGFNADSLGPVQVPSLQASQSAIRDAAGLSGFNLSAGRLSTAADSRIVTAPLIAEFGLTSRLTIGVVIPLVQTRTTFVSQLNQPLGNANVGFNPALGTNGESVRAQNTTLVESMKNAATALQSKLTQCQAAPTMEGCSTLLVQQANAQALMTTSGMVADAIARLYGTSTTSGSSVVPLASNGTQATIDARIQLIKDQYRALLGNDAVIGGVTGAQGPMARAQLNSLLAGFGRDTLSATDRSSIGDITVGATLQLANTFVAGGDTAAGDSHRHIRLAVNGAYRIATGQAANRNRLFDVGTGYGQPGIVGGAAADVQLSSRWTASAVGSYTMQLGSQSVSRVPNVGDEPFPLDVGVGGDYSAGNMMVFSVVPRYRLSGFFGLTARYAIVRVGADKYSPLTFASDGGEPVVGAPGDYGFSASTSQQVGFGFIYSTIVGGDRRPGRIPFEISFDHLETIAASGGPTAKSFRDQIELRIYPGGR